MFNGNDDNKDTQPTFSIGGDFNSYSRTTNQIDGYTRNSNGEFTQETTLKNLEPSTRIRSFSFNFEMPLTFNPRLMQLGGFGNLPPTPYVTQKIFEELETSGGSIHDYDVKIGDIKLQYDSETGLSLAAGTNTIEKTIAYNVPLIDIAEKIPGSKVVLKALKNKLIEEGHDPKNTVLKEITILGPGVELGGNFGKKGIGFEAGAKVAGIKFKFARQINSEKSAFIECTFNAGAKFGKNIDSHTTKNNKHGYSKETHIAMGSWEVSVGTERNNENKVLKSSIAPINWKNSPKTRAEKFLQSHGLHPEVLTKKQHKELETILKHHETTIKQQLEQAKQAKSEQIKAEKFKETIETAQSTLKSIALIGEKFGVPALSKIADFGQSMMSLNSVLTSSFKMNIPILNDLAQGLALLNPITSIISIGLQIASLFGFGRKKKQDDSLGKALKQLSEQLVAIQKGLIVIQEGLIAINTNINQLQKNMQEYFKHCFGNQQIILESIINLSRSMLDDFKAPVMNALYEMQGEINRLQINNHMEHVEIYLSPFEKLLTKIELLIDPELVNEISDKKLRKKLFKYTSSLYEWICKSSNDFFTGKNYLELEKSSKWERRFLLQNIDAVKISSITSYLVNKIEILTKKPLPETINKNQLMNLMLWQTAVSNYFELINCHSDKLSKNFNQKALKKVIEQSENYLNLLSYIASNTELFEVLKKEYQGLYEQINRFISDVFYKMRSDKNTVVPQGKQPLYALIPENTLLREQLNPLLDQIDTVCLLFNIFAYLGGLNEYDKQINELHTSEDILKQSFNFSDINTAVTAWSDTAGFINPSYYETIHSSQMQIDGTTQVVLLSRNSQTLQMYAYNTETNIWRELLQENPLSLPSPIFDSPNYYKTIRTEVIDIKGKDHLVFMVRRPEGFHIYTYDPSVKNWDLIGNISTLADNSCGGIPQPYPCVLETIRTNVIVQNDKPQILVMFNSTSGYMVYGVDPVARTVQQIGTPLNGWARFINTGEDSTTDPNSHQTSFQYYTTIRTEVVTLDGVSYLLAMIRDENACQVMQLDLHNGQWQAIGTKLGWADQGGYFNPTLVKYNSPPQQTPTVIDPNIALLQLFQGKIHGNFGFGLNHPSLGFLKQLQQNQNPPIQKPPVIHTRIIASEGNRITQYYESIRTVIMTINNVPHFIAAVRHSIGLQVNALNLKTQQWQTLGTGSDLNWIDKHGWNNDCYINTFRLQVIHADKEDILIASIRRSQGIEIHAYDTAGNSWRILNTGNGLNWTDESGYIQPYFYKTLRVEVISNARDGQDLLFMCRNNKNMCVIRFPVTPSLLSKGNCGFVQEVIEKTVLNKNGIFYQVSNELSQILIIIKYQAGLYSQCLNENHELIDRNSQETILTDKINYKPKKELSNNQFILFKKQNETEVKNIENFAKLFMELTKIDKYSFNIDRHFELKQIIIKFTSDEDELFEPEKVKNNLRLLGKFFRKILIENGFLGLGKSCQCDINLKTKILDVTNIDGNDWQIVCQLLDNLKDECEKLFENSQNKTVCVIF